MRYVPTEDLRTGMILAQDVLSYNNGYPPLLTRGQCLNTTFICRLCSYGLKGAYIQDEFPSQITQPSHHISHSVHKEAVSAVENVFEALRGSVTNESVQAINQLDAVIDNLANTLIKNSDTLININHLKSYDDYTYHHSVNVAILSMAIGTYLHFEKDRLEKLGKCAILHDIGKTKVPIALIRKPGKLTSEELREIQSHSRYGYECLMECGDEMSQLSKIVLHHHEKVDGSGYPHGLKGSSIPFFSRIISVADVYDALTSHRPYRDPISPNGAAEYIMGGCDTHFDSDVVNAFLHKVELYGIGSYVELSNGAIGKVLAPQKQNRPLIQLIDNKKILDLYHDPSCLNIVINHALPLFPSSWKVESHY